jgi:hypothetical protein
MRIGLRVDTGRGQVAAAFFGNTAEQAQAILAEIAVHRLEPFDSSLCVLRQLVIGVGMLTYCVSPPLEGRSTANSIVALGGRGWLE